MKPENNEKPLKVCPPGYENSPVTGRCIRCCGHQSKARQHRRYPEVFGPLDECELCREAENAATKVSKAKARERAKLKGKQTNE